jgi:hypothetical protein
VNLRSADVRTHGWQRFVEDVAIVRVPDKKSI